VCLLCSHVSQNPHFRVSRNSVHALPIIVAPCSFGGVGIRFALPVFVDDVMFSQSGPCAYS